MAIVEFRDVSRIYRNGDHEQRALDHVNLSLEEGKFIVVLGPSGAGKSTLLNMLGGLDSPTEGTIVVNGKDISTLKDEELTIFRRRKIGFVFQAYNLVQELTARENKVASIEVSAITTPDNDLARRAAKNPQALSSRDYETWYCTAYVSAICYQIQEAIPNCVASAVRQVAESEGAILEKTQLLMILITALSLVGSALGISNLVTASVMERAQEIGLLKAIGAKDRSITGVIIVEILITALIGGVIGYFMGFGFAQLIGHSVFGSAVEMKLKVVPIVAALIALVTMAGSLPAIRTVLRLRPAEVLHGGH